MAGELVDLYVKRALTLMRAAEGEAIDVAKKLDKVFVKIQNDINRVYSGSMTKTQLKSLKRNIERELKTFYLSDLPDEIKALGAVVIERELDWTQRALLGEAAIEFEKPKLQKIVKRASRKTYQGHTFNYWIKREAPRKARAINSAISRGFINGSSIEDVAREVGRVTGRATADVRTLVRSNFMHNASTAKEMMLAQNEKHTEGVIWVSVLDASTTWDICGVRGGLEYDHERNPVGHNIPWLEGPGQIHWNCRSTAVPVIKGVRSLTGYRPAIGVGSNYKSGDNKTRTGRVRRYSKSAKEKGFFKVERKKASTRYEQFLREQSRKNLDYAADILGNRDNARRFRDGQVSLYELGLQSPVARPLNRNSI